MKLTLKWLLYLCSIHLVMGARILGAFMFPSYSHQIVFQAIWEELALRGHDVLVFTPYPLTNAAIPNLQVIEVTEGKAIWSKRNELLGNSYEAKNVLSVDFELFGMIVESMLAHPAMQAMVRNASEHFDLVMMEWLHPAFAALSAHYQCPLVGISSLDLLEPLAMDIGNPIHPTLYPNFFLPFVQKLSFWERLVSIEFSLWVRMKFDRVVYPFSDQLVKKYLGSDIPPVKEIANNVSMTFVNINKLFSKPRAYVPTVVEFSGIHMKSPKSLPKDIQEFLDDAPHGVIYFSLGSTMKSDMFSKELKFNILEALKELPYKVLWKYDNSSFSDLTENMKIVEWLPQQDVLAHPNVKVFVTQGGIQSLEEAVRRKVPLVGIPFIIDQPRNMMKMVQLGTGQMVDKATLTKESLKKTIIEVAENSRYRTNIARMAELLDDEPMKSMDKIMWWMEYVIKHKGTSHMRSPYLSIPAYQYFFIDIFIFAIICLTAIVTLFICTLKCMFGLSSRLYKRKLE